MIANNFSIPYKEITGDPNLIFEAHPFIGIISNFGVLLWCSSTVILLFSYLLLFKIGSRMALNFLVFSCLITMLLLIDDLFMLHDYLLYSIGLNQNYMYGLYSLLFILYVIKLGTYLIHTKHKTFLVLAFLFLGSSVGLDLVFASE